MLPAARMTDLSSPDPCGAPPRICIIGSGNVFLNDLPAHRMTDAWADHACPSSPSHSAITSSGSGSVFVNDLPAARMTDQISCGSIIAQGSGNIFIG